MSSMRNPNGYGSVVKLTGKRRKPYCVRLGTKYTSDGSTLKEIRTILGYYSTKSEAMQALAEYNRSPYEITSKTTFREIFDKWLAEKPNISTSRIKQYNAAFGKCLEIQDRPISELRLYDFQAIIDRYSTQSEGSLANIKQLITGICGYAMRYDLIAKDYSQFIKITRHADPTEKHKPFTEQEINELWNQPPTPERDMTLILIYSGWRISELLDLDSVNFDTLTMTGGKKTRAGKGRVVPIHHRILPLLRAYSNEMPLTYLQYFDKLGALGHLPHDTRHTFISRLSSAGADKVCVERLAGHSSKGVTDKIYTHKDLEELRRTIELLK